MMTEPVPAERHQIAFGPSGGSSSEERVIVLYFTDERRSF
jgi:hypothetical protein